jgi:hypothetical protein
MLGRIWRAVSGSKPSPRVEAPDVRPRPTAAADYVGGWARYGAVVDDDGRTIEEWKEWARAWAESEDLGILPGSILVRRRVGEGKVKVSFDARP